MLGDSAESPRFVETLPRRGYRFVAPVEGDLPTPGQLVEAPPAPPKTTRRLLYYGLALLGAAVVAVAALVLWKTVSRPQRAPKVLSFTQLTSDGQEKTGPMVTDGSRIYFTELSPDGRHLILQVSVKGGEATPFPAPLKQPEVLDLSKDGTELLVANYEDKIRASLWVQPVAGGSPRRVGSVLGGDARFGPDGIGIIYGEGQEINSMAWTAPLLGNSLARWHAVCVPRHSYGLPIFARRTGFSIHSAGRQQIGNRGVRGGRRAFSAKCSREGSVSGLPTGDFTFSVTNATAKLIYGHYWKQEPSLGRSEMTYGFASIAPLRA